MKKKNKDWLALSYIIPWAIGGTLAIPVMIIIFALNINILESLSYAWWLNIAVILLLLRSPIIDTRWIEELEKGGFIEKRQKV